MKFFDELDIERVNQQLNFETGDCKVSGGCDLFTTKPAGSDKKLYKTIDKHLDTLVQENEVFRKFLEQHPDINSSASGANGAQNNSSSGSSSSNNNTAAAAAAAPTSAGSMEASPPQIQPEFENNSFGKNSGYRVRKTSRSSSSASINSFWEQKRRMSATDSYHVPSSNNNFNQINSNNDNNNYNNTSNSSSGHNNDGSNSYNEATSNNNINYGNGSGSTIVLKQGSNKLNEENLEKLMDNSLRDRRLSSSGSSTHKRLNHTMEPLSDVSVAALQINMGPFGPLNEIHSRKIFSYLIGILNASYPDHDFTSLAPTDFSSCSLKSLISKFENSLISLGKQPQEWIWDTINLHMDLSDCAIYQYNAVRSFMDDEEPGHLWSQMWFLFNKKRKRVAYLYLTVARLNPGSSTLINQSGGRRRLTIEHHNMNSFEGEYDLTYEENAIDDDDEEMQYDDEDAAEDNENAA